MLKPTEAEILKYYINVFASLRVTFANIFYEICKSLSVNTKRKILIDTGRGSPEMYLLP